MKTQRQFSRTTAELSDSFTRLSSGLRINRARDDAAGLAISTALKTDSLVYSQSVRNVNDAVSMLNIAEGATQELSRIVIRQRELSSQAANGTLSRAQRKALDDEANALVDEFNRIVESTSFNNQSLLVAEQESIRVQAGYGTEGGVSIDLTQGLARNVSDGTYQDPLTFTPGDTIFETQSADINGDGAVDILTNNFASEELSVMLGNGDGTFKANVTYDFGSNYNFSLGDINGDSITDVVGANSLSDALFVMLGTGDGTFKTSTSIATPGTGEVAVLEDFNGDSALDILVDGAFLDTAYVLLNDGSGNFSLSQQFSGATGQIQPPTVEDFNGDGIFDFVAGNGAGKVRFFQGNADGTFAVSSLYDTPGGGTILRIASGDFDGDGQLDIVTSDYNNGLTLLLGNGDGSFKGGTSITSLASPVDIEAEDINGDGVLDLGVVFESVDTIGVYLGKGDGTFESAQTFSTGDGAFSFVFDDFNNDGALDIAAGEGAGAGELYIHLANTTQSTRMDPLDLRTSARAKEEMARLDEVLVRINKELGNIGAGQSRLAVAGANLKTARENFNAAASRIEDVDVAKESARLVRGQILQQAGAAILGQANQEPALALTLLGSV